MNPKYPVYVPTKGRWQTPFTIRALRRLGVPFRAVVEEPERERYAAVAGEENLLVLPHRDRGLVATRNWIWDHAQASGVKRFWTFDDNITGFHRYNRNAKYPLGDGTFLAVAEDFAERYENVPIAGFNYEMFIPRKYVFPPVRFNTRIYSNMLIETDARDPKGKPYRNEGFYNDDTDLCLRVLKDGYCTALINAFLARKITTMKVKGGMTPHYQGDGRLKMAEELRAKHPDVTKVAWKYGRWQHQVDYRPFKANRLVRRPGFDPAALPEVDDYGMRLRETG